MSVTTEQWQEYLSKYENLMWMISHRISGDSMISSLEDNFSDLCVAAINSVNGFNKKTGEDFEEMMMNPLFDKYTKTVLWNLKNKKGKKITKKIPMLNRTFSLDDKMGHDFEGDTTFAVEDKTISYDYGSFEDLLSTLDDDSKKIVDIIVKDPSVLNAEGILKVGSLVDPSGLTIHSVRKAVAKIEKVLGGSND